MFSQYFIEKLERFPSVPAAVQVLRLFIHSLLCTPREPSFSCMRIQHEMEPLFPLGIIKLLIHSARSIPRQRGSRARGCTLRPRRPRRRSCLI